MAAEKTENQREDPELKQEPVMNSAGLVSTLEPRGLSFFCSPDCLRLRPKDKEHQRKKVLRTFFSWRSKQPMQNEFEHEFWTWIKAINPDNSSSEVRWKSISSQFLDELLDEDLFRNTFGPWLSGYETSLDFSEDDQKTKVLVQFLKRAISAKHQLDLAKTQFLMTTSSFDFEQFVEEPQILIKKTADLPGCYVEAKCLNTHCKEKSEKVFAYVGTDEAFDYVKVLSRLRCIHCDRVLTPLGIGFKNCRWICRGSDLVSNSVDMPVKVCRDFTKCCSISLGKWKELQISVTSLTSADLVLLDKFIASSFRDCLPMSLKRQKVMPTLPCEPFSTAFSSPNPELISLLDELSKKNQEIVVLRRKLRDSNSCLKILRKEEKKLASALADAKTANRID